MRGFTVIELLVVAAIMGIVSLVVVVGQNSFNRSLLLTNTASDIALSLRNAQVFGIGSRATNISIKTGYGIYFSGANSFSLFADIEPPVATNSRPDITPGDGLYTAGNDILVQTYTLNNGIKISNYCATTAVGASSCLEGGGLSNLSIVFKRPNTTATFKTTSPGGPFVKGCVTVTDKLETAYRYVSINRVGQISTATSCS